jgi:Spy/CpxP family protein refolding chaperone
MTLANLFRYHRTTRLITAMVPVLAIAGAAAPLALPAAASAQAVIGGLGGGPVSAGRIGKSALERYAKVLHLDEAQRQAAAALHDAYAEGNRAASKDMAAKMKDLEPQLKDGDMDAIENKIPAVMEEHGKRIGELEQTFLDDLKALLTPQQADSDWPRLERLRRREQWLRTGVLSGSNVDLTTVVDSLRLPDPDRAKLTDTLDQYEVDMDRVLQDVARAAEADQAARPAPAARRGGAGGGAPGARIMTFDAESMRKHMDKQREQSTKVKDVNQRYARLIAAALPEEFRAKLDEQYKVASFKSIYRDTSAAKKLAAAEKFDDLTPAQRDRLQSMADNYRRQARAANDRWAAAQEQAEAAGKYAGGGIGMVFNMHEGGAGDQPDDLKDARKARRELDKQFDSDLASVLTDAQKDRLPKVQTSGRMFGGQNVDVIADGDGNHAVFVSAVAVDGEEGDVEDGGEDGVIVTRQVIVTHGDEQSPVDPQNPPKKDEPKKEEPKK